MRRKFSIGARVIAVKEWDGNLSIVGTIGTVVGYDYFGNVCVAYDEFVGGHTLNGLCQKGHGWRCPERCLGHYVAASTPSIITLSYEEVML